MITRQWHTVLALVAIGVAGAAQAQSVVPTRAIRALTIIGAEDVKLAPDRVPGAHDQLSDVIGREARSTLYPGRPIQTEQIGPAAVVERNQIVSMTFNLHGLSISAEGRALDRAGLGERVRVMNIDSRMVVTGIVTEGGRIKVGSQ